MKVAKNITGRISKRPQGDYGFSSGIGGYVWWENTVEELETWLKKAGFRPVNPPGFWTNKK